LEGGDNFFPPFEQVATLDTQDEVLVAYIQSQSPVEIELDGRIAVVNGAPGSPGGGNATSGDNATETGSGESGEASGGDAAEDAAFCLDSSVLSTVLMAAIVAIFTWAL
jgi:hypothetical protein